MKRTGILELYGASRMASSMQWPMISVSDVELRCLHIELAQNKARDYDVLEKIT